MLIRHTTGSGNEPILPQFVHDYLSSGVGEGERNDTVYKVAQQFFAAGFPIPEAEAAIMQRAVADGLSEGEAKTAIASAYKSTIVTEPIRFGGGVNGPASAPKNVSDDFLRMLEAAFKPNELVAICEAVWSDERGKWSPGKASIKTRTDWEEHHAKVPIDKVFPSPGGVYIGINPVATVEGGRKNDNIAVYRHVLIEFDSGSLEEQRARIENSGFPISVVLWSADRSVHGWAKVDAKDKAELDTRRDFIFETLGCDPKNKDIARLSRCAGATREVDGKRVKQTLLATHVGPPSWPGGDALPPLRTLDQLEAYCAAGGLPDLIEGLLAVRSKMMVCGPSKARKSWTLLDLAISVASGSLWLGFKCVKGLCIFIDGELHPDQLLARAKAIGSSRHIGADKWAPNIQFWNLRGYMTDVTALVAALMATLVKERPKALFLDPIYKLLGNRDENKAGDINSLLNELEQVAKKIGCCIFYTHHFAKGDASEKSTIDRGSGSGVWARDADSLVFFTPPPKGKRGEPQQAANYAFTVECIARAHRPIDQFKVKLVGAHFERISEKAANLQPGSLAAGHADILTMMPRTARTCTHTGENADTCPLIIWISENCHVDIGQAFKIFNTMRNNERYDFIKCEGEGVWVGKGFLENNPF